MKTLQKLKQLLLFINACQDSSKGKERKLNFFTSLINSHFVYQIRGQPDAHLSFTQQMKAYIEDCSIKLNTTLFQSPILILIACKSLDNIRLGLPRRDQHSLVKQTFSCIRFQVQFFLAFQWKSEYVMVSLFLGRRPN